MTDDRKLVEIFRSIQEERPDKYPQLSKDQLKERWDEIEDNENNNYSLMDLVYVYNEAHRIFGQEERDTQDLFHTYNRDIKILDRVLRDPESTFESIDQARGEAVKYLGIDLAGFL